MKILHFQERILEPWIGPYYYLHFYLNHLIVCPCFLNHTHYTIGLNMNHYLIPKPFRIHALLFINMLWNKLLIYDISGLMRVYSINFFPNNFIVVMALKYRFKVGTLPQGKYSNLTLLLLLLEINEFRRKWHNSWDIYISPRPDEIRHA